MPTRRSIALVLLIVLAPPLHAEDPPTAPTPFILQSVEEKYSAESAKGDAIVSRAESEAAKLRKLAAEARLKVYRDKLAEVTKAGDFDKAIAIKARIEQLEKEPESEAAKAPKRARPKDTVKFQGHMYALIKEPATWHVAKQRCEEMGGHLVCLESEQESEWLKSFLRSSKSSAWIGATDEQTEGQWIWVTGHSVGKFVLESARIDNAQDSQHWMAYWQDDDTWNDAASRLPFVCEWETSSR